jgi:AP-3 complex subunit beta
VTDLERPAAFATAAGKSLVRISRNRREIQYVVLKAIASMAQERPQMFRPFLPDFFVKATDASFCRILKLDILTALTDRDNVTQVVCSARRVLGTRGAAR